MAYGTVTLCGSTFLLDSASQLLCNSHVKGPTTPQRKSPRFGLFPVRSPLLRKSIFLSSPAVTEMFQFTAFAAMHLWIQCMPVRESRDRHSFDNSPELFAVFHALLRLLTPRHPPCALSSLTTNIQPSLPPRGGLATADRRPIRLLFVSTSTGRPCLASQVPAPDRSVTICSILSR